MQIVDWKASLYVCCSCIIQYLIHQATNEHGHCYTATTVDRSGFSGAMSMRSGSIIEGCSVVSNGISPLLLPAHHICHQQAINKVDKHGFTPLSFHLSPTLEETKLSSCDWGLGTNKIGQVSSLSWLYKLLPMARSGNGMLVVTEVCIDTNPYAFNNFCNMCASLKTEAEEKDSTW